MVSRHRFQGRLCLCAAYAVSTGNENGTMACVLPHGVLFRGAAEGHIRKYLIEDRNWLDAVIGLPANIFYGTSIPTSILVFKKCKEHPEQVLFIDASQHFEKAKNQNYLRGQDIDKIIDTYRAYVTGDLQIQSPPSQGEYSKREGVPLLKGRVRGGGSRGKKREGVPLLKGSG